MALRKVISSKHGGNRGAQSAKSNRVLVEKKRKVTVKSLKLKLAKQRVELAKLRLKTNRMKELHATYTAKVKEKELECAQMRRWKDQAAEEDALIRHRIDLWLDMLDAQQERGNNKAIHASQAVSKALGETGKLVSRPAKDKAKKHN